MASHRQIQDVALLIRLQSCWRRSGTSGRGAEVVRCRVEGMKRRQQIKGKGDLKEGQDTIHEVDFIHRAAFS